MGEEFRIAGVDHGDVVDADGLLRGCTHDQGAHGDAVVVAGFDQAAAGGRAAAALDHEAVFTLFGLDAIGAQHVDHGFHAICFLDAQLFGAGDDGFASGEGGQHAEDREFVDHGGDEALRHVAADQGGAAGLDVDQAFTGSVACILGAEAGAHEFSEIIEAGAGRVGHDAFDENIPIRRNETSGNEEGGRGGVARDCGFNAREFLAAKQRDGAGLTGAARDAYFRAEAAQHAFGMVAGGFCLFDDRCAVGIEAGQHDGGLDLGGGLRRGIGDGLKRGRTGQAEGEAAVRFGCVGEAHLAQGRQDAVHRAGAEAGITAKFCGEGVPGHQAHHQARAGAGIAEIERGGGGGEAASACARDLPLTSARARDRCAEGLHRRARAQDVITFQKAGEMAGAVRNAAHDERAMTAGLVAGGAKDAVQAGDGAAGPDHDQFPVTLFLT